MAIEVKDAEFVSAKRADKVFGRDCMMHYIIRVGVKNPDNDQTYYADLPLIFTVGQEWAFYDKESNTSKKRKLVAKDTTDAIAHARKVFPAWAEFIDSLPETAAPSEVFKWFDDNANHGITVRASFKDRAYTGSDGMEKIAHDAQLWETFEAALPSDFDAQFGKSLKAAGMKFSGATKTAAKANAVAPKMPSVAATAPTAPTAPKSAAKKYTHEDSWQAYQDGGKIADDPNSAKYWTEVARITGKDAADWESFTSEDWRKCVEAFALPF